IADVRRRLHGARPEPLALESLGLRMVDLDNRDGVRPSRLAVGEGVQSRAKNGVLVDALGNRARNTIFGDAAAQAEMDARGRIRHGPDRPLRGVPDACRASRLA